MPPKAGGKLSETKGPAQPRQHRPPNCLYRLQAPDSRRRSRGGEGRVGRAREDEDDDAATSEEGSAQAAGSVRSRASFATAQSDAGAQALAGALNCLNASITNISRRLGKLERTRESSSDSRSTSQASVSEPEGRAQRPPVVEVVGATGQREREIERERERE